MNYQALPSHCIIWVRLDAKNAGRLSARKEGISGCDLYLCWNFSSELEKGIFDLQLEIPFQLNSCFFKPQRVSMYLALVIS